MHKRPSVFRLPAWRTRCVGMVVLALLWGWLLAPLVQTLRPSGSDWVQVCTSLGTKFVQLGQDDGASASTPQDGQSAPSGALSTDCSYCRAHASLGLEPTDVHMPVVTSRGHAPPLPPPSRPVPPEPTWSPALPRAPPSTTSA